MEDKLPVCRAQTIKEFIIEKTKWMGKLLEEKKSIQCFSLGFGLPDTTTIGHFLEYKEMGVYIFTAGRSVD